MAEKITPEDKILLEYEQQKSTQKRPSTRIRKRAMLAALVKSLGVVQVAAMLTGIDRTTHYLWLSKDERYKKAVDDLSEIALDFAESKLHNRIEAKDTTAIIFYLKTKGKQRGYIENPNIVNTNNLSNTVELGYGKEEDR